MSRCGIHHPANRSVKPFLIFALLGITLLASVAKAIDTYPVESPYQNGQQEIRVLTPDSYSPQKKYRVVYILPVGSGTGSALRYFQKLGLANEYDVILAEMSFEKTPWFGDHPSDPKIRQESYVKDFVVPFVEKKYSTLGTREGRMLFGFSKSGWGAFALILRQPDFFGYAASWDAPYMFADFHYGMDAVFGDTEHLKKYRPDLLVPLQKQYFQSNPRLFMGGEEKWGTSIPTPSGGSHTVEMEALLNANHIAHVYRPDLKTKHTWSADWIVPMFAEMMKAANAAAPSTPPH